MYSPDCLRKTFREGARAREHGRSEDQSVHDPQGVWQMLKDQPWRQGTSANVLSNACAVGFLHAQALGRERCHSALLFV